MNTWWFDGHLHIMSEKRMKSGIRWAIKADPLLEKYADRIMFGSDYAMAMEPIGSTWERFAKLPISEECKNQIGQRTPLQLLRRSGWPFRGEEPISYREVVDGENASHNSSSVR